MDPVLKEVMQAIDVSEPTDDCYKFALQKYASLLQHKDEIIELKNEQVKKEIERREEMEEQVKKQIELREELKEQTKKEIEYMQRVVRKNHLVANDLKVDRGFLQCRGALEEVLRRIFYETGMCGNFNATHTCNRLSTGEYNTRSKTSQSLRDICNEVGRSCPDGNLISSNQGDIGRICKHVYGLTSHYVHRTPEHGAQVRKLYVESC